MRLKSKHRANTTMNWKSFEPLSVLIKNWKPGSLFTKQSTSKSYFEKANYLLRVVGEWRMWNMRLPWRHIIACYPTPLTQDNLDLPPFWEAGQTYAKSGICPVVDSVGLGLALYICCLSLSQPSSTLTAAAEQLLCNDYKISRSSADSSWCPLLWAGNKHQWVEVGSFFCPVFELWSFFLLLLLLFPLSK